MADIRHIENRLLAVSQWMIVRLTRKLVRRSRIRFCHKSHDQNTKFRKFKMADSRSFENGFIAISQPGIIRFQWNLVYRRRFWFQERTHMTKTLQLQNGRRAPYGNSFFGYISTIYWPINAKFGLKKQNRRSHTGHVTKIPNFKNSRWRTAAILKMVLSVYLSLKSTTFNEIWCRCRFLFQGWSRDKI